MWGRLVAGASFVFVLDRLTKFVVLKNLTEGESIKVLPNIFHITLVLNKGAAFGLFQKQTTFFILLALLAVSFIIFYAWKENLRKPMVSLGLALMLGGALGNLLDRILSGRVIDFLDFRIWPVFNVADSGITIGAAILVLQVIFAKMTNSPISKSQ